MLGTEVRVFIDEPLVLVFFLLLGLPLAGGPFYARIPPDPIATWAGLDATDPADHRAARLRSRWAIVAGIAATIGVASTTVALYAGMHAAVDPVTRDRELPARVLLLARLHHAVLQLVAAIGAAIGARSSGASTAAGGVGDGIGGVVVVALTHTAQGCVPAMSVVVGRECGKPAAIEFLQDFGRRC